LLVLESRYEPKEFRTKCRKQVVIRKYFKHFGNAELVCTWMIYRR